MSNAWLYIFVVQPHREAMARWNRVRSGWDTQGVEPVRLKWKDRLIYLISGLALALPLIATIVWMFMITFGNPDYLSPPYHIALQPGNS